jgi:hypothetical protein
MEELGEIITNPFRIVGLLVIFKPGIAERKPDAMLSQTLHK